MFLNKSNELYKKLNIFQLNYDQVKKLNKTIILKTTILNIQDYNNNKVQKINNITIVLGALV